MITKKFFTKEGHIKRQNGLINEDWSDFYAESDPNKAFEIFQRKYSHHYNNSITIKSFFPTHSRHPKQPWMTPEILKKIRKRDRIAKLSHRREDYRQLRNEIVADCRKAEKHYWTVKITENLNNIKEQWKILRQVMGQVNDKTSIPSEFKAGPIVIKGKKA